MTLDDRIYTRIGKEEKVIFQFILKKKLQNQNVVVRALIRDYMKEFFINEVKEVTLDAGKVFGTELNGNADIAFSSGKVECKQHGKIVVSYKWDDVFESHVELLEYALDA